MSALASRLFVSAAAILLVARPVFSHHSFAAEFDGTKPVTLKGTVTKVEWVSPHGWVYIDVKGPDGTVVGWAIETAGPNALLRRGVRKTDFPIGSEVVVSGYRAKNGTPTANASTFTVPDGRELIAGSSGTGAPATVREDVHDDWHAWPSRRRRAVGAPSSRWRRRLRPRRRRAWPSRARRMEDLTSPASGRSRTRPPGTSRIIARRRASPPDRGSSKATRSRISPGPPRRRRRTSRTGRPPIRKRSATCRACRGSPTCRFRFRSCRRREIWSCCTNTPTPSGPSTPTGARIPSGPFEWWLGDSRGHWEGDTLVVDLVQFNDKTWFDRAGNFHSDALHVVERYTPTDPDHIDYVVTIEDPKVFTRPWTMRMILYRHKEKNFQILEYECYGFDYEKYYP